MVNKRRRTITKKDDKNSTPGSQESDSEKGGNAIMNKIDSEIKTPLNWIYFVMGFLQNWLPRIKHLYKKVKKVEHIFTSCKKAIEGAVNLMKYKVTPEEVAKINSGIKGAKEEE